ncbi:hypothetical protein, partial [Yersinia proxima]|uniref:hypothetical protein n=1 Tax=Yersinia proxima TaxID=2890316 RepID=UPI0037CEA5D1
YNILINIKKKIDSLYRRFVATDHVGRIKPRIVEVRFCSMSEQENKIINYQLIISLFQGE